MKYPCLYVTYWRDTGYPEYTELDGQPIEYQVTVENTYHDHTQDAICKNKTFTR